MAWCRRAWPKRVHYVLFTQYHATLRPFRVVVSVCCRWYAGVFASISGLGRGAFCLLSSLGEARRGNTNACDGVGGAARPSSLRLVTFGLANPRVGWVAWRLVGLVTTIATPTEPGAATAGLATNPAETQPRWEVAVVASLLAAVHASKNSLYVTRSRVLSQRSQYN